MNEPPAAPNAPTVIPGYDPRTLHVTWIEPANTGPDIIDYTVQYRERGHNWQDWDHVGTAIETTIVGLKADTKYDVKISATNPEDTGHFSDHGTGDTDTNVPPTFTEDTASGINRHITETPEDETEDTARDVGVAVAATDSDDGTLVYRLQGDDHNDFTIDNTGQITTKTGQRYDFEAKQSYSLIVEVTDEHLGETTNYVRTDLTVIIMDVDEPPDAPTTPSVTKITRFSADVTWSVNNNVGRPIIDSYAYQLSKGSENTNAPTVTTNLEAGIDLDMLENGATYYIRATATNDEGTSDPSAGGSSSPTPTKPRLSTTTPQRGPSTKTTTLATTSVHQLPPPTTTLTTPSPTR